MLFFDTDSGRESRVARDDGAILSEAAEEGKSMGMFVGVALDDDIAGADGAEFVYREELPDRLSRSGASVQDRRHTYFCEGGSKIPCFATSIGMATRAAGV